MSADRHCREVLALLDELADGTLDDARARVVRAHLRGCSTCAAREQATRTLVETAAALGNVDPPSGLWRSIAARLDQQEASAQRRSRLWWWWQAWRRSLLAGAGVVAAAGLALWVFAAGARRPLDQTLSRALPRPPVSPAALYDEAVREVARAEQDYTRAIDELRGVAAEERRHWRPEAARQFDDNLAAIDAAIERQAAAFRGPGADPAATDALHAMYRKKIDFLQEAIIRGGAE